MRDGRDLGIDLENCVSGLNESGKSLRAPSDTATGPEINGVNGPESMATHLGCNTSDLYRGGGACWKVT